MLDRQLQREHWILNLSACVERAIMFLQKVQFCGDPSFPNKEGPFARRRSAVNLTCLFLMLCVADANFAKGSWNRDRFSIALNGFFALFMFIAPLSAVAEVDVWNASAYRCVAPDGLLFPSKMEGNSKNLKYTLCDDGDMTLFNGILCYSGVGIGCESVKRSQTSNGRFWRSPLRAQNNNLHFEDGDPYTSDYGRDKSFSPDMETGVLLWAMKTKNDPGTRAALDSWFAWMSNNRPCMATRPIFDYPCPTRDYPLRMCRTGGGCILRNLPRYCEHENCTMRPLDRDMDNAVFNYVMGKEPPDGIGNYNNKVNEVLALGFSLAPVVGIVTNAYLSTPVGDKVFNSSVVEGDGFVRHLTAIRAWMLVEMKHPDSQRAKDTLARIASFEPNNALFQYFFEGATPRVRQLALNYCPPGDLAVNSSQSEWMWEQGSSASWSRPKKTDGKIKSMYWDCIAVRSLLDDPSLGVNNGDLIPAITSILLE